MHRFQLACIALEQRLALDGAAIPAVQPPPTGASVTGSGAAGGSSAASGGTFGTSAGAGTGSQANPNPANPGQSPSGGIYIGLGAVSPVGDPGTLVGVVISAGTSPILNVAASAASAAVTAIGSAIDSGLTALSPQTQTPPIDSDVPSLADPTDAPGYFPDSAATAFAPAPDTDQPTQTTPIAPY